MYQQQSMPHDSSHPSPVDSVNPVDCLRAPDQQKSHSAVWSDPLLEAEGQSTSLLTRIVSDEVVERLGGLLRRAERGQRWRLSDVDDALRSDEWRSQVTLLRYRS